jgi:hypothetical protein
MRTASLVVVPIVLVAISGYLVGTMFHSIRKEKRSSNLRKTWANFGLSIAFCVLFLISWGAQAVAEWSQYAEEQRTHNQPAELSGYVVAFGQSSLENWQSEFLQLFAFVVLSATLIHRGSAESKDSDDRMEELLKRIADKVGVE